MARGRPSSPAPLPKVSFVKVEEPPERDYAVDKNLKPYGYDSASFSIPKYYLRYIEPLESELSTLVEYDMDEQDREWLDAVNADRKHHQMNSISYELFEIAMDQIEKQWFALNKRVPKSDLALPSEDSTCSICDDAEGENSNAIVFCDGCNLAVHQDCYGVPYIPEGQWLCRKCTVSPENPVSCILCPNEGGAFKQTVTGEWAHLLCAIWIPETRVANEVFMEPITGVERISKQRWKLKCSLCSVRGGACIQCSKSSCFLAFHVTCAREEKFLMPMKSQHGTEPEPLTCFCYKHLPPAQAAVRTEWLATREAHENTGDVAAGEANASKTARAYAKTYTLGPPLVPHLIYANLLVYIEKFHVNKQAEFMQLLCRYWSLKREARRGAPLLKRLHLEPWTASNVSKQQTDEEKALKLRYLMRLRDDLEQVRMLTQLCQKRERAKQDIAEVIDNMIKSVFYPHHEALFKAWNLIQLQDSKDFFKSPVDKAQAPDYEDAVKEPMCWDSILKKVDDHAYWDVDSLKRDLILVLDNAMQYNPANHDIHKLAKRMKDGKRLKNGQLTDNSIPRVFEELDQLTFRSFHSSPAVGELEPPLDALEALFSVEALRDHSALDRLIVHEEPLASLFRSEIGAYKPKSPSPSPQPKAPKRKRNRGKTIPDALDRVPSSQARRTRGAVAAETALEGETATSGKRTRKTATTILPGQGETLPMVEDVDQRTAFERFDGGWILPSGSRRHARPPPEPRGDLPPPRKRMRTGPHGGSRLSQSTAASENRTLEPKTEEDDDANGAVLEEIDTPATRRQKNLRKKEEKARRHVGTATETPPAPGLTDDDSDLSELTELSSDDLEDEDADSGPSRLSAARFSPRRGSTAVSLHSRKMLESGTLVWGKVDSFPWWPSIVFDADDPDVPDEVLEARNRKEETRGKDNYGPLHLVQFYDRGKTWGWVNPTQMQMFGEDDDSDLKLLVGQRYRNDKLKQECRAAYKQAKAEMETPENLDDETTKPRDDIEVTDDGDLDSPPANEKTADQDSPSRLTRASVAHKVVIGET